MKKIVIVIGAILFCAFTRIGTWFERPAPKPQPVQPVVQKPAPKPWTPEGDEAAIKKLASQIKQHLGGRWAHGEITRYHASNVLSTSPDPRPIWIIRGERILLDDEENQEWRIVFVCDQANLTWQPVSIEVDGRLVGR